MQFQTFIETAEEYASNTGQRRGQAMFNTLVRYRPELSEIVRATNHDPFYSDARIPAFLNWLKHVW